MGFGYRLLSLFSLPALTFYFFFDLDGLGMA